jgi:lysophospholipase L1-like esterase
MTKKRLLAILTVILIIAMPFQVLAAKRPPSPPSTAVRYVNLGDSIAYGMSASIGTKSYTAMYSNYLDGLTTNPYSYASTATPGWKTGDLLASITSTSGTSGPALMGATVVTICIGSNNLLGPIIDAVAKAYGLNPNDSGFLTTLQDKIAADPVKWNSVLANLYLSAWLPWGDLHLAMDRGVTNFNHDWPLIISGVKAKASKAKISVLTVYDPMPTDNDFYDLLDPLIVSINRTINTQQTTYKYRVIDVYNLFRTSTVKPNDFDIATGNFDPHPNDYGHDLIYDKLIIPW